MTDYWPSFRTVVDVPIDKSLSFNSRLVTYLDYVLSIHSLALLLSILITTEIYLLHPYRRLYHLFIAQISVKISQYAGVWLCSMCCEEDTLFCRGCVVGLSSQRWESYAYSNLSKNSIEKAILYPTG